jgi:hypothetical protein
MILRIMKNIYIYITNQMEHSLDIFLNLRDNFDLEKMKKINITYNFEKNKYFITDGVHRLSILLYKKLINDNVPINFLDIKYDDKSINHIEKLLLMTKNIQNHNGWNNKRCEYGYHSFNIFNINLIGQRSSITRLEILKNYVDFKDKNILDFGCNSGGMLLHLFDIKNGIGIDFDENCVKTATSINNILNFNTNIKFIQKDLDDHKLELDTEIEIDIVFLFSVGSWIKNWKYIYL